MQDKAVEAFKNELKNYYFYLDRIKSLKEMRQRCYDWLSGVTGIDPSREPTHSPPNKNVEYAVREEIEHHEANIRATQSKLNDINKILAKIEMPLRTALIDVYANKKTARRVAEKMFISPSALFKRMDKAIKKALED